MKEASPTDLTASKPFANNDQRRSLFVRSLATTVTTDHLAEHFSQSYPIKHALVVLDRETKNPKGYGFVTFADSADARFALTEFDQSLLDGRKIRVELAESRHREIIERGLDTKGRSVPSAKAAELKAAREQGRTETAPPRLIVRNLPWSIKEPEDLALLFRSYGKVKHAVVPKRGPKAQAGFGFVLLRGRKNAEKALEGVNGKEVDGRTVAVDWAVDKETWEGLQKGERDGESGDDTLQEATITNGNDTISREDDQGSEENMDLLESESSSGSISVDGEESDKEDPIGSLSETDGQGGTEHQDQEETPASTIFIRNLPYDTTDDTLFAHFRSFGPIRYARVVYDPSTGLAKGTGFVCFYDDSDAKACVQGGPKTQEPTSSTPANDKKRSTSHHSILQDPLHDPTGRYTLSSRILTVTRAVSKSHATHLSSLSATASRNTDKRHLYLLSEGTVPSSSPLHKLLSATELNIRSASYEQRQRLVRNNPGLHVSLTRLSVRNVPRGLGSKELKALAREAVVGFAKEVKEGKRSGLNREELNRDKLRDEEKEKGDDYGESEEEGQKGKRKDKGKGVVKQAKIVFEGKEGGKVREATGAGRSRGYGFIEYRGHREALMGLRWLNGHPVRGGGSEKAEGEREGKKRLIVEFALENAQVVARRKEMEKRSREKGRGEHGNGDDAEASNNGIERRGRGSFKTTGSKRKRVASISKAENSRGNERNSNKDRPQAADDGDGDDGENDEARNKTAKRNRIIAKKRQMRKTNLTSINPFIHSLTKHEHEHELWEKHFVMWEKGEKEEKREKEEKEEKEEEQRNEEQQHL
ncbi:MAG: hypothetical protein Q9160_000975 [Pyrenula sp. 1 TL-2023]